MSGNELEILDHPSARDWLAWLKKNHASSTGIWLRLAKKAGERTSASYSDALEAALCYGWIDAQKESDGEHSWLQRFTPRRAKSIWSKINRQKALDLLESRKMKPTGIREVERAKQDGRWDAAYDSPGSSKIPEDFQLALDANPRAKAFFETLNSQNRYAVLFRIQTVKLAATRERRIAQFVEMLERHEKLHP